MRTTLMQITGIAIVWAFLAPAAAAQTVPGDAASGERIARQWCAACHLVGPDQALATPATPSFAAIAAKRTDAEIEALEVFLAAPHPPMPDLNLTRREIADLTAYIASLR